MRDGIVAAIQIPLARLGFDSNRSGIGIRRDATHSPTPVARKLCARRPTSDRKRTCLSAPAARRSPRRWLLLGVGSVRGRNTEGQHDLEKSCLRRADLRRFRVCRVLVLVRHSRGDGGALITFPCRWNRPLATEGTHSEVEGIRRAASASLGSIAKSAASLDFAVPLHPRPG